MGGKLVILYRRGRNFAWIRPWIHLDPLGARMRQVYYLQHFCLDPCLDTLGSTGSQNAPGVLFTTLWLGSVLGSTWIHWEPEYAGYKSDCSDCSETHQHGTKMGAEGEQASKKIIFCSGAGRGQAQISRNWCRIWLFQNGLTAAP